MEFDEATLRHVARLARLRLDDAELRRLSVDVKGILAMFETMPDAPPRDPPSAPVASREDEVASSGAADDVIANLPRREGRFVKVDRWE